MALTRLKYPVEGFQGGATRQTKLWVHFVHHHVRDVVIILEEGNQPYLRCPKCDMFLLHKDPNVRNLATEFFRRRE